MGRNNATDESTSTLQNYVLSIVGNAAEKLIFLDVDGVLHSFHGACRPFYPRCMRALARIVQETAAVIVLSSSWRLRPYDIGRGAVDKALAKYGIAPVIGQTPHMEELRVHGVDFWRAGEIKA